MASDDTPLITVLTSANAFPTEARTQQFSEAFSKIQTILTTNPTPPPNPTWARMDLGALQIVTVGSYGYGLHDNSSDLDITVVGGLSPPAFYRLVQLRARIIGNEYGVKVSKFVDAKDASMLELVVSFAAEGEAEGNERSVMVDLHYAQAPNLVVRWEDVPDLPHDDILLALPQGTRRKINAYRDMVYIMRTIPNKEIFALAYRFIRTWAKRRCLYSSRFGLLSGFHITLLLSRVVKMHREASSASEIISFFFRDYSLFLWDEMEVVDPEKEVVSHHKRSWTEPISILTPNAPHINVSANATKHSVYVLEKEFGRAWDMIKNNKPLEDILGSDPQQTALEMLSEYTNFIKIDLSFWGSSLGRGKNVVGWTEFRIARLLLDIQAYFHNLRIRPFPTRFRTPTTGTSSTQSELTAFYLLGVHNTSPPVADASQRRILENKLLLLLDRFREGVKSNEIVYNAAEAYVECKLIRSLPKNGVELDTNSSWDFLGDTGALGEDSAATTLDDDQEPVQDTPTEELQALSDTKYDLTSLPPKTSPLRPAHDVLNRLRWDSTYDIKDFVVGYDDRFLGILEMGIEAWQSEMTGEEWIPMHRVVYFKKVSDGAIVWDRRLLLDSVFGSGRGSFTPKVIEEIKLEEEKKCDADGEDVTKEQELAKDDVQKGDED